MTDQLDTTPTPEPEELNPTKPEVEDPSTEENDRELQTTEYEQTGPVIEEGTPKGNLQYQPSLAFYNYGLEALTRYTQGEDLDSELIGMYTPDLIHTDTISAPDSYWVQHIKSEDRGIIGPRRPRLASAGGTLSGMAAIESIRRVAGAGGSLTYELAHSGLVITVFPVKETEMIDMEFDLTKATTQVGMSTTGLLLNSRSGVFSEALVNLALDHISSCNFKAVGTNFRELIHIIDPLDYGALIWGMLATTMANGHPWEFACSNGECGHTREALINFSRMLWINKNGLTEKQRTMLVKHGKEINEKQLEDYRNEFEDKASTYTMENGIVIHWKRTNMANYLKLANEWVSVIEERYNTAMTNYFTEAERRRYLSGQIQARRMHKYLHQIDKILIPTEIEGEYDEIAELDDIYSCLLELTSISPDIRAFENAAIEFIEANTIQVVGYPGVKCPSCEHVPTGRGGEFRTIIPVAVDRVFFMLVQRKTLALTELANV